METTCLRGFSNSFLPDREMLTSSNDNMEEASKVTSLQYIQDTELERTWKTARRQRLKQQEDKIWSEFVKEKDAVLQVVSKEDPYQFLEQLPEATLKNLMDTELKRLKFAASAEAAKEQKRGAGDTPRRDNQQTVTFTELEQDEMFRIFEDERDENDDFEGIEEDMCPSSPPSPCTVRERDGDGEGEGEGEGEEPPSRPPHSSRKENHSTDSLNESQRATASKSSENVANMIESSIYCAKVRELRIKIIEVLNNIMTSIESVNVACFQPHQLRKMVHRATEFSSRFQRIHIYQIQRQVEDIERHNQMALPFAKHTQFQSQMSRVVVLHQYILQALNVFLKCMEQTWCLRGAGAALAALCAALLGAAAPPAPPRFAAATDLYGDDIEATCIKLQTSVKNYTDRVSDIVDAAFQVESSTRSKKSVKSKDRKKKLGSLSKSSPKTSNHITESTARLSMYSFETIRRPTSRAHVTPKDISGKEDKAQKTSKDDKSPKIRKSPRCRGRPLMRAPSSGQAPRRAPADTDIRTLVEAVEPPSSQISRETSPHRSGRRVKSAGKQSPNALASACKQSPNALASACKQSPNALASACKQSPNALASACKQSPNALASACKQSPNALASACKQSPNALASACKQSPNALNAPAQPPSPPGAARSPRGALSPRVAAHRTPRSPFKRSPLVKPALSTICSNGTQATVTLTSKPNKHSQKQTQSASNITEECNFTPLEKEESLKNDNFKDIGNDNKTGCDTPKSCSVVDSKETGRESRRPSPQSSARKDKKTEEVQGCEVSRLLKQLCGGDGFGSRNERCTGAKNAQLLCFNSGGSPRPPSTPQLLRILEETIQKKAPKTVPKRKPKDADRLRLAFNIPQHTADKLYQYRTKFVQHMLTSSLYANSAVGKPWEMIGCVSENIIDEMLLRCAKEMEIEPIILELYKSETQ